MNEFNFKVTVNNVKVISNKLISISNNIKRNIHYNTSKIIFKGHI